MEKHLLNILKEANTIIIPRLGALTITNDTTGEIMFMPYLKYDDGKLAEFIATADGISKDEAKSKIDHEVEAILNELESNNSFSINGVGTFSKGDEDIEFKYDNSANATVTESVKTETKEAIKPIVEEIKEVESKPIIQAKEIIASEVIKDIPSEIIPKVEEVEKKEETKVTVSTEDTKKTDKADLKAQQKADKEAKDKAEKENKEKVKLEKEAKAKSEKEAKLKAKEDKKNKTKDDFDSEGKPKKKRGFLFWIIIALIVGSISGGAYLFLGTGDHDNSTHHNESGNHDKPTDEEVVKGEGNESGHHGDHSGSSSHAGTFYIIIGSFGEKVNAEGLAERMVIDGHSNASVIERNGSYSVVYSKYSSKEDALNELDKARSIAKNAWVLTTK